MGGADRGRRAPRPRRDRGQGDRRRCSPSSRWMPTIGREPSIRQRLDRLSGRRDLVFAFGGARAARAAARTWRGLFVGDRESGRGVGADRRRQARRAAGCRPRRSREASDLGPRPTVAHHRSSRRAARPRSPRLKRSPRSCGCCVADVPDAPGARRDREPSPSALDEFLIALVVVAIVAALADADPRSGRGFRSSTRK